MFDELSIIKTETQLLKLQKIVNQLIKVYCKLKVRTKLSKVTMVPNKTYRKYKLILQKLTKADGNSVLHVTKVQISFLTKNRLTWSRGDYV